MRVSDPLVSSYHSLHWMFNEVPYVYVNSFAATHASVKYFPLFKTGTVQFTILQTGAGDQTLVDRHVVSPDLGIYPVLQVNETDLSALYICFSVFDNRPLATVGKLHASENNATNLKSQAFCVAY